MSRGVVLDTSDGRVTFLTSLDEVTHLDVTTSGENREIILLLLESWLCLLADSPLIRSTSVKKPKRLYANFMYAYRKGPLREFIATYSGLAHKLVSNTGSNEDGFYTGPFLPAFKDTPIFAEYLHWFKTGDIETLRFIYTFLNYGKKLDFRDQSLETTAFRGWLDVEEKLSTWEYPVDVLDGLKTIVTGLVPDFAVGDYDPKFGPGAVADKGIRGNTRKANGLYSDPKLKYAFGPNVFTGPDAGLSLKDVLPDVRVWEDARFASGKVSELLFVPKDYSKARSICMEPNSFMFFQQMVLQWYKKAFKSGPIRRFVNLSNQRRNRDLAQWGSYTSLIDTVDLSSASDSVGARLVEAIFPRQQLFFLLATRTSQVLTEDGVRSVHKFAPMGSALCFPVQCMIFTSVVIYAAMQVASGAAVGESLPKDSRWLRDIGASVNKLFRRSISYRDPSSRSFEPAAVYGDDICCDRRLTEHVFSLLTSLGFSVNTQKSFTGDQSFRESCGGFYFGGEDITPLYFRVKQFSGVVAAKGVASLISQINRSGDRRLRRTRSFLITFLLSARLEDVRQYNGKNPIAFVASREKSWGIYSLRPRNSHLQHTRVNPGLQREEFQCIVQTAGVPRERKPSQVDAHERYLYLRWWKTRGLSTVLPEDSDGSSIFDTRPRPDKHAVETSGSRMRRGWMSVV